MKQAIVASGHGLIEVGLYQSKDDKLVVHGVFEVKTREMADQRSKILREFLTRSNQLVPVQIAAQAGKPKEEVALPLVNLENGG